MLLTQNSNKKLIIITTHRPAIMYFIHQQRLGESFQITDRAFTNMTTNK